MAADLIVVPRRRPRVDPPSRFLPGVRLLGFTLRGGFLLLLAVMVAHASLPRHARLRTMLGAVSDLMRIALGAILFGWVLWQGLALRERAPVLRTSLRFGLAGAPLVICLIAIW